MLCVMTSDMITSVTDYYDYIVKSSVGSLSFVRYVFKLEMCQGR